MCHNYKNCFHFIYKHVLRFSSKAINTSQGFSSKAQNWIFLIQYNINYKSVNKKSLDNKGRQCQIVKLRVESTWNCCNIKVEMLFSREYHFVMALISNQSSSHKNINNLTNKCSSINNFSPLLLERYQFESVNILVFFYQSAFIGKYMS